MTAFPFRRTSVASVFSIVHVSWAFRLFHVLLSSPLIRFILSCQAQSAGRGPTTHAVAEGLYLERSCGVHRLALRCAMGTCAFIYCACSNNAAEKCHKTTDALVIMIASGPNASSPCSAAAEAAHTCHGSCSGHGSPRPQHRHIL